MSDLFSFSLYGEGAYAGCLEESLVNLPKEDGGFFERMPQEGCGYTGLRSLPSAKICIMT